MDLNYFIFPKPKPSYTHEELFGKLIYIPHDYKQWGLTEPYVSSKHVGQIYAHEKELKVHGHYKGRCVPCLYLPCAEPSSKVLLYFHGNAEDVALTQELIEVLQHELKVHVLVMEYEGYGVYGGKSTAESIIRDSELLFFYVTSVMRYASDDIIVFGRSIGSGPASFLASKHRVHSLILMSAFTSLRAVVKDFVGPLLQYVVADRFPNKTLMKSVKCPVFLIHGEKDDIVSCKQAMELKEVLEENKVDVVLHTPKDMDHNAFSFEEDFVWPLLDFYESQDLCTRPEDSAKGLIVLPIKAFNKPTAAVK